MNGPFYEFGWIGEEASLAFALITGVAFGFFLERAGLGSAKKLAGQFYFRDMTVFKMMLAWVLLWAATALAPPAWRRQLAAWMGWST